MTFNEAMEHFAYGRKIRRECWSNDTYIVSNGDRVFFYVYVDGEPQCIERLAWSDRAFSFSDVVAEDWEFYV